MSSLYGGGTRRVNLVREGGASPAAHQGRSAGSKQMHSIPPTAHAAVLTLLCSRCCTRRYVRLPRHQLQDLKMCQLQVTPPPPPLRFSHAFPSLLGPVPRASWGRSGRCSCFVWPCLSGPEGGSGGAKRGRCARKLRPKAAPEGRGRRRGAGVAQVALYNLGCTAPPPLPPVLTEHASSLLPY